MYNWHQFVIIIICSDNVCSFLSIDTGTCIIITRSWVFLYTKINQLMNDFSLRNLNFSLNEIHKGQYRYVLYIFKWRVGLRKKYLLWGAPTDTQERFYFPCNKWLLDYLSFQSFDYECTWWNYFRSGSCTINSISTFLLCYL